MFGLMKVSTHKVLIAQAIWDAQLDAGRKAARAMADLRGAHGRECGALRGKNLALQNEIAALNGKLVHHMDNPEPARLATSGLQDQKNDN